MSADQEVINLAGTGSENQTLFDELAGLVPAERQAEYYRVIAHTRTLSPNDEVLRVLEAMGIAEIPVGGTFMTSDPVLDALDRLQQALSQNAERHQLISERIEGMLKNYDFVSPDTLAYFAKRPPQAERDSNFALSYVKQHAKTPQTQAAVLKALEFKCDVLWSMLDALHHAYVTPKHIPPGAFVPNE